jgi:hypothetical protein
MHAPQIIVLILLSINVVGSAFLHGKPKKSPYSFTDALNGALITSGLIY